MSDTGYVNWPDGGRWENTHEGGQYVFAFFMADAFDDPFFECMEVERTIALRRPDVVLDGHGVYNTSRDSECEDCETDAAASSVLAAVCLGTSSGSWSDTLGGGYFMCARSDLTADGEALVQTLEKLYSRPAKLVTYLDT